VTRRADWLIGQLPMGMLDDSFFVRYVSMFQEVATTFLEDADNIPNVVDVTVAPLPVVRWLGSWIGQSAIDSSLPDELQRRLVREAGRILAWRGTRRGLVQFLEVVTGAPAEVEESGAILREGEAPHEAPFVRMRVASSGWLSDEDFVELVADEIPANVTFELHVGDRRLWPAPAPGATAAAPVPPTAATPAVGLEGPRT
jgi:phage tail-like protein